MGTKDGGQIDSYEVMMFPRRMRAMKAHVLPLLLSSLLVFSALGALVWSIRQFGLWLNGTTSGPFAPVGIALVGSWLLAVVAAYVLGRRIAQAIHDIEAVEQQL